MWMRPLALAALALILAPFTYGITPLLSGGLVFVAVAGSAWAFAVGVLPRFRPRDAYDLGELRRVHEQEEIHALDPDDALGVPERVVCSRCFQEYDYRLRACPRCGAGR